MLDNKKKRFALKKWWPCLIVVVLVICIAGTLSSCYMLYDYPYNESNDSDVDTPSEDVSSDPEDVDTDPEIEYIEISAVDLLIAYEENGVAADSLFKGKMLKVTGIVRKIDKDIFDDAYVALQDDRRKHSIIGVRCYFENDMLDKLAELTPGDEVVITGKCTGSSLDVTLEHCDLVE